MHQIDVYIPPVNTIDLELSDVSTGVGALAPRATATFTAHDPTVTAVRNATVNAPRATSVGDAYDPSFGGSSAAFTTAVKALSSGRAYTPVVTTDATVQAVIAAGTEKAWPAIGSGSSGVNANTTTVIATGTGKSLAPTITSEVVLTGGGPGTGSLIAIPPTSVTGTSGGGVVTFDAVSAGTTSHNLATPITWTHTCTGTNRAVIVAISVDTYPAGGNWQSYTRTATYGGVAMTSLMQRNSNDTNNGWVEIFGLLNPPTGAQTISVSATRSGFTPVYVNGCSVSYTSVANFEWPSSSITAPGGTPSLTIPSGGNRIVVGAFCSGGNISGVTGTQRALRSNGTVGYAENLLVQDAAGNVAGTTVGAANNNDVWAAVGISMFPA